MTVALFKLESFSNVLADHGAALTFTQQDIDQAYADGISDAKARAEDDERRNLGHALERLALGLAADEAQRCQLRQEAVEALSPILTQILDLMAPPLVSRRLEQALTTELHRLAQRSRPVAARIACSDRLRTLVERCLAESGLEGISIDPAPADRIAITLQGGRIEFAPDTIAGEIKALIAEMKEDDSTWTH